MLPLALRRAVAGARRRLTAPALGARFGDPYAKRRVQRVNRQDGRTVVLRVLRGHTWEQVPDGTRLTPETVQRLRDEGGVRIVELRRGCTCARALMAWLK